MEKRYRNYKHWKQEVGYPDQPPDYIKRQLAMEQIGGLLLFFVVLPAGCIIQVGEPYQEAQLTYTERQAVLKARDECEQRVWDRQKPLYITEDGLRRCHTSIVEKAESEAIQQGRWKMGWGNPI